MSSALAESDQASPAIETRTLGRYALRYRVGQGGMASVYLAQLSTAEGFRKWVAVKTVHPHIAEEPRFVQMFLDEARLAARMDHPNVCSVFDFGEANGTWFLAMEYLHGESLSSLLRRAYKGGQLPLEIAVRIVADAARGLHAAHELQMDDGRQACVVHRDVSPQNIFVLYSGVAKVVDFGIARSEDRTSEKTETGELKGKIAFMSPEQIHQGEVDRRADVWALGVVLWESTVGRRLFKRANEAQTMAAVLHERVMLPSEFRAGYPGELEEIVMHALDRRLDRRTPTALEFARSLEAFLANCTKPAGVDEVGEYVRRLFADKVAMREDLLKRHHGDHAIEVVELASDRLSLAPFELVRKRALPRLSGAPDAPRLSAAPRTPSLPAAPRGAVTVAARPTAFASSKRAHKLLLASLGLALLLGAAVPTAHLATRGAHNTPSVSTIAPAAPRASVAPTVQRGSLAPAAQRASVAAPETLVIAAREVPDAALAAAPNASRMPALGRPVLPARRAPIVRVVERTLSDD